MPIPKASLRKMRALSEAHIERTCTEWLELDGWRSLKTNPVSNRTRGAGFGEIGMADYLYIRYANKADTRGPVPYTKSRVYDPVTETLWVEWKRLGRYSERESCRLPTKADYRQIRWHDAERARGALTLIAGEDFEASIEGFQKWYRESGLMRRKI